MATIDSSGSATMHLTSGEYGAVRERVRSVAPESELARVLADAQPAEHPRAEPTIAVEKDERGEDVNVQTGTIVYAYAITIPPGDQQLAADALRLEVDEDVAATVADFTPPEDPPAIPITDSGLILPA